MSRWARGQATITKLLSDRQLQIVKGEMTDGQAWLDKASRTLGTAGKIATDDPESALVLCYDAARQIGTGLLAQQGLRPTTEGGHIAVVRAIIDQFNGPFADLDMLRRRRNELQYPSFPGELVEAEEVKGAIAIVHQFLDAATKLIPVVGFFAT
jgi:hypothetical protein